MRMCSKAIKSDAVARRIFLTSVFNDFLTAHTLQAMCHTHVFLSSLRHQQSFIQIFLKHSEALFSTNASCDFRQTALTVYNNSATVGVVCYWEFQKKYAVAAFYFYKQLQPRLVLFIQVQAAVILNQTQHESKTHDPDFKLSLACGTFRQQTRPRNVYFNKTRPFD